MNKNRIEKRFQILKLRKQKAFIAFLTAGFPDLDVTEKLILKFEESGVDLVEIGVPFSDPLADGPTIQAASTYALNKGINLNKIFSFVYKLRQKTNIPIALMTYCNPVLKFGIKRFIKACNLAGVDGVIIPDLPPEESKELLIEAKAGNVVCVGFLAPTSDTARIKLVDKSCSGFIYYVSLTGVTGSRKDLPGDMRQQIKRIKKFSKKPVCVGFGVSRPDQVKFINKFADGVIVGSVIIKAIADNLSNKDKIISAVTRLVKQLCIKRAV